ncbi:hypothetical protein PYW07_010167 [Mythimna separata]|uniref:Tigger transposable element-derived protein 4 n=1 Tax=Mythimna separata TaxID=271217 RepID=A0AAD8DRB9_MYTSE|nr:hypothetical protein PYW07_010167 [Mythimna separata]
MSGKRKHKTLALKDKIEILKKLENGGNMCKLAKEYGVGRATLHDLKTNKQKILEQVKMMKSGPGQRKTLRVAACPKMEKALYTWFMEERSKHTRISGDMLKAKALELYRKITKKDDFRASNGWLHKFKERNDIRWLSQSNGTLISKESFKEELIIADEEEKEDERVEEILEEPTTTAKVNPDKAFDCFNTCITWAEENDVSAKDIKVLRDLREKVFAQRRSCKKPEFE